MSDQPSLPTAPRVQLTPEAMLELATLYARGYTARYIGMKLKQDFQVDVPEAYIVKAAFELKDQIHTLRVQAAEDVLSRGVARREERVIRLNELAESWEERAQTETKAAGVYLKVLGQVAEETSEWSMSEYAMRNDPWANLLRNLREKGPQVQLEKNLISSSNDLESESPQNSTPSSATDIE